MKYQALNECVGAVLATDIKDEKDRLILQKGSKITARTITRLKNFGVYCLCIEEDTYSNDIDLTPSVSKETIKEACQSFDDNTHHIDIDKAFESASKLVDELCNNTALLGNGYKILKTYDENTSLHSVNVATLAVIFGINLGLNITKLNNLGVGALLHDIGKAKIPKEILNKSGKLDPDELIEIRKHPQYGYDILNEDILVPATIKAIIHQHHENYDGSGYPRNIKKDEIYDLAAIVHICDVFDALISKRSYKDAFSYEETIEYMQSQSGIMFNPYYLKYFFRYVPIFHAGTDVMLSNGEKAIVVRNNLGDMTRPTVRLYKDKSEINLKEHLELKIVS